MDCIYYLIFFHLARLVILPFYYPLEHVSNLQCIYISNIHTYELSIIEHIHLLKAFEALTMTESYNFLFAHAVFSRPVGTVETRPKTVPLQNTHKYIMSCLSSVPVSHTIMPNHTHPKYMK